MIEESIALANVIPDGAVTIMLDETGESLGSADFRGSCPEMARRRSSGRRRSSSAGPTDWRRACGTRRKLKLAFGTATWPHQMVRIMLLEQIYRAITILSGHPYHRE